MTGGGARHPTYRAVWTSHMQYAATYSALGNSTCVTPVKSLAALAKHQHLHTGLDSMQASIHRDLSLAPDPVLPVLDYRVMQPAGAY